MPRKRRRVEEYGAEENGDVELSSEHHVYATHSYLVIATFPSFADLARIHDAIMKLPATMDFSNPAALTRLPFPSPIKLSSRRFEWHIQNNIVNFSYMGRSKFTELYNHTQSPNFLGGLEQIYLYGTSGSGKSHILAALVCRLIHEGKRVLYVPGCSRTSHPRFGPRCAPHSTTQSCISEP